MLSNFLRNPVRALVRFEYQRFFASVPIGSVDRRLSIQYTCKVCNTRQVGIIIASHLILSQCF